MKGRLLILVSPLLFLPLAVSLLANGQATLYPVRGKVVSQQDGHPIARANLQLLSLPDRRPLQSTISSAEGAFAFADLPAGHYELKGEAAGFLTTIYDQHEGFSTAIVTGSTVSAASLVFQLVPRAILSGVITDSSGDAVFPGSVLLFRHSQGVGQDSIVPAGTATANDLGQYEFANLAPGSYLLAVQAQPWYANNETRQDATPVGISGPSDPGLRVAYPVTYYPGVTDPLQASALTVSPGDNSADLRLGSVPALQLSFPSSGPRQVTLEGGRKIAVPGLRLPQFFVSIFGTRYPASVIPNIVNGDGVVSGIAPGDYVVNYGQDSAGKSDIPIPVRFTQSGTPDLSAQTGVHLLLTLHLGNGSTSEGESEIVLVPARGGSASSSETFTAGVGSKGQFEISVPPGDYDLHVTHGNHPVAIRQVVAGATAVSANPLHIAAPSSSTASVTYTITGVAGSTTVTGVAQKDGAPGPGVFILLVPVSELQRPRHAHLDQSDLDGSFNLSDVADGSYFLFAIENGWQINWREDGAVARYLPGALRVEVPDSKSSTQRLQTPVQVQPKL